MTRDVEPALGWVSITPNDSSDNLGGKYVRSLWVGGAGDVSLLSVYGETVTFKGVPAGMYLDCRPKRVLATNTTATDIVGMY